MKIINNLKEIGNQGKEVVLFSMPSCGPCKMIKVALETLHNDLQNFGLYEIDGLENYEVVTELGIRSTPTVLYFKDGVEVQRKIGYESLPSIRKRLQDI